MLDESNLGQGDLPPPPPPPQPPPPHPPTPAPPAPPQPWIACQFLSSLENGLEARHRLGRKDLPLHHRKHQRQRRRRRFQPRRRPTHRRHTRRHNPAPSRSRDQGSTTLDTYKVRSSNRDSPSGRSTDPGAEFRVPSWRRVSGPWHTNHRVSVCAARRAASAHDADCPEYR